MQSLLHVQFLRPLGDFNLLSISGLFVLERDGTIVAHFNNQTDLERAALRAFETEIDKRNREMVQ
jgi:hypothetical protein